jgi:hypothetical protein
MEKEASASPKLSAADAGVYRYNRGPWLNGIGAK